jgi:hypothetical protein
LYLELCLVKNSFFLNDQLTKFWFLHGQVSH